LCNPTELTFRVDRMPTADIVTYLFTLAIFLVSLSVHAERLRVDPVVRHVVGARAMDRDAVSTSQMAPFETGALCHPDNIEAPMAMPSQWVDRTRQGQPTGKLILNVGSLVILSTLNADSVSIPDRLPYGEQFALECPVGMAAYWYIRTTTLLPGEGHMENVG